MEGPMDIDSVEDELNALKHLRTDRRSYIGTLQSLANRSRDDLNLRRRLARAEVIQFLTSSLQALRPGEYDVELERETLRSVGNACAMNTEAIQEIAVVGFEWYLRYMDPRCPGTLQSLACAVLYNISAADFGEDTEQQDRENPALNACFNAGVHIFLIRLLAARHDEAVSTEDMIDMLFWISSAAGNSAGPTLPDDCLVQLASGMSHLSMSLSAESLSTLIESIVVLLRPQAHKARLATSPAASGLLTLLEQLVTRIDSIRDRVPTHDETSADLAVLSPQSSSLTWLLSDISAEPDFAKTMCQEDPLVQRCLALLLAYDDPRHAEQLDTASALVVGNSLLNMPEQVSTDLVAKTALVSKVTHLALQTEASPDLLHSLAGLLMMLTKADAARQMVLERGAVVEVVEKLCRHEVPQVRDAGVRLLRALGKENISNQERLAAVAPALESALRAAKDDQGDGEDT